MCTFDSNHRAPQKRRNWGFCSQPVQSHSKAWHQETIFFGRLLVQKSTFYLVKNEGLRECARPALKVKASKYVKLLCVHFISRCLYSDGERGTRHSFVLKLSSGYAGNSEFWRVRRQVLGKRQPSWSKALPWQREPGGKSAYEKGRPFHGAGELMARGWTKELVAGYA